MRLLFLTHYFHPEVGAAQTRILELADDLHHAGHQVTILTGFPNYPDGVIPEAYRGRRFARERLGGLEIVRSAVYPAPNRGTVRRLLNHASFALSAIPAALRTGPVDAVIVESPPLFLAVSGVAVARLKRARMVLNVADLWPEAAVQLGALSNRRVIRAAEAVERFAYRHSDLIAVPTPGLVRILRERGYAADRILSLPHGVDTGRFPLNGAAAWERRVAGRVVYCGTIGLGHAVETLIEAARTLEARGEEHEVLVVGDGAERAELEARARAWGLRSVTFRGRVPRGELPALLATAAVTVATQRDRPLLRDALSTKVLEYMAAARPVVVAASGWTAQIVDRAQAGLVCPPEQPVALADAISRVIADPEGARIMGEHGRRYVEEHLTRGVAVERLARALTALTGPPAHSGAPA